MDRFYTIGTVRKKKVVRREGRSLEYIIAHIDNKGDLEFDSSKALVRANKRNRKLERGDAVHLRVFAYNSAIKMYVADNVTRGHYERNIAQKSGIFD